MEKDINYLADEIKKFHEEHEIKHIILIGLDEEISSLTINYDDDEE